MSHLNEQAARLSDLAELAKAHAEAAGAEAKIVTNVSTERRLVVESGEYTLAHSLESQSLGLAVHKGQKKGSASTNITTPEAVRRNVDSALALASFGVEDPYLSFVPAQLAPRAKPLSFLYEDSLAGWELGELKECMNVLLRVLTKDPRLALDRFEMSISVSQHSLRNSLGVCQEERQAVLSWSYLGMARDGEVVSGMDYQSGFSLSAKGFLPKAEAEAQDFVARVIAQLSPRPAPSYKGAVLLSPRAVEEILLGNLLYHASGRSVMDGKSRWDKSLGQRVVAKVLSLSDAPHNPALSGATAFDSDGMPTRALNIIVDGVLETHLHDAYSAKRLGLAPMATAGAPFSLCVAPGKDSLKSLQSARSELLYVDRFSGNADPLTGDFSGVVKGGRLFAQGRDAGPVGETMIAGNVFQLAEQILGVSQELHNVSGRFLCPSILVDGLNVSGAGTEA